MTTDLARPPKTLATRTALKLARLLPARIDHLQSLADVRRAFHRARFEPNDIPGWMHPSEQKLLYLLAAAAPGDVLEVGPWLGRSTVCLARGVMDSGRPRRVVTCELAPSIDCYREIPGDLVGFFGPNNDAPEPLGTMPREAFDREKRPYLEAPGGFIAVLQENLRLHGVGDVVKVVVGDFHDLPEPDGAFSLIFADVTHSAAEVEAHAPAFRRLLAPGGVLACHDAAGEVVDALRHHFQFTDEARSASILAGIVP